MKADEITLRRYASLLESEVLAIESFLRGCGLRPGSIADTIRQLAAEMRMVAKFGEGEETDTKDMIGATNREVQPKEKR